MTVLKAPTVELGFDKFVDWRMRLKEFPCLFCFNNFCLRSIIISVISNFSCFHYFCKELYEIRQVVEGGTILLQMLNLPNLEMNFAEWDSGFCRHQHRFSNNVFGNYSVYIGPHYLKLAINDDDFKRNWS